MHEPRQSPCGLLEGSQLHPQHRPLFPEAFPSSLHGRNPLQSLGDELVERPLAQVEPQTLLVDFLREQLRLTGIAQQFNKKTRSRRN